MVSTFDCTGTPHVMVLLGSRKTEHYSQTALSEIYTKASVQKLESAALYCTSLGGRQEHYSQTALSEIYTKASVQKLESAALYCTSLGGRQEHYSQTALSEAHYSEGYLYYCNVLGGSIHNGTLLHSKSQYTTVKRSQQLFKHTYTSDLYGTGTLIPIEFFQQDLLWQSSNTHSHSFSQKTSRHTSGQSIVGLSVHLHTTMTPRRIVHH
jgi:hypothetical protein